MLTNAYFLAKFRFDTAKNEPARNLQNFEKIDLPILLIFPQVRDQCSVVFMGGAIGLGNKSPTAEFNVHFDPEATQMVALQLLG